MDLLPWKTSPETNCSEWAQSSKNQEKILVQLIWVKIRRQTRTDTHTHRNSSWYLGGNPMSFKIFVESLTKKNHIISVHHHASGKKHTTNTQLSIALVSVPCMDAAVSCVVDMSGFLVPVEVKDTPQYGHLVTKLPGFFAEDVFLWWDSSLLYTSNIHTNHWFWILGTKLVKMEECNLDVDSLMNHWMLHSSSKHH